MKIYTTWLCFSAFIISIQGFTWNKYLDEKLIKDNKGILKDISKFIGSSKKFSISTLNNFVDKFFENWDALLKKLNLDPLGMKDVTQGYWWGDIMLRNIYMDGMSSFRRSGDTIMKYNENNQQARIDIPIGIGNMKFECTFKASVIGIGPGGTVTGGVDEIEVFLSILVDLKANQATVEGYNVTKSGHVKLQLHGDFLTGWVLNLMDDTTTFLFRGIAAGAVDLVAGGAMRNAVDVVNTVLEVLSLIW